MQTRFSFGGDEHIFAEVGEAMSLEAFFKSLFITNAVRDAKIKGVTEICPANASYQVKFDPDQIKPDDLLTELKRLDSASEKSEPVIKTRIIEIPVLYNDPWTHETLMRFRERHQDPNGTDLEYAARINGFTDYFLTKLDVLTGIEKIPVCVAYEVDGVRHDRMPMTQTEFHHAKPVYEHFDGWTEDISGARTFTDLPLNAQRYVEALEKLSGCRISAIGVGPGRDQVVQVRDLIED